MHEGAGESEKKAAYDWHNPRSQRFGSLLRPGLPFATGPDRSMTPLRSAIPRLRHPLLFVTSGPLTARLGAAFFKSVPPGPGVYFFYDGGGRLLYIGQSHNLRRRIGSYRFVNAERHARRTA